MKNRIILFILLFAYTFLGAQITVNTNFQVNSSQPIDSRDTVLTFAGLAEVAFPYEGMTVYVLDSDQLYLYKDAAFLAVDYITSLSYKDVTADGGDIYDFRVQNAGIIAYNANGLIQLFSDSSNINLIAENGTLRIQAQYIRMINVDRASTATDTLVGLLGITSQNDSVELFQFSDLMFNFLGDSIQINTSYIATKEYVDKRDSIVQIYLIGAQNTDDIISVFINNFHANNPQIRNYEVIAINNNPDSILTVTIPNLSDSSYVFNQVKIKVLYVNNTNGAPDGLELIVENDSLFYGPEGRALTDTLTVGQYCAFQGYVYGAGPNRMIWQEKPFSDSDDVSATGGIWEEENSNTLASDNTTDNYHAGNIGIGDFSGTTIGATIHVYDVTNARLRLSDSAANDTVAQAYIEYYRGYATNKLGQIGYTDNTDLDLHIENHLTGGGLEFRTDNVQKMKIYADGQLQLDQYGSNAFTGTVEKYLAVTSDGLVVETEGGGAAMTQGAPLSAGEGSEGDLKYNDNYLFYKSTGGWRRIASESFDFTYINIDTMPDLLLWLVADSLSLSNGANVATWTDESGNGNDYSQAWTSQQPTYVTNDVNGHASVSFDGNNDILKISDLDVTSDSIEVYIVYNITDLSDGGGIIGNVVDSASFLMLVRNPGADSLTRFNTIHSSVYSVSEDPVSTLMNQWVLAEGSYNKIQTELSINGTSKSTNAETGALDNPAQQEYLGGYVTGLGVIAPQMKVAEVIIFTTYHGAARRAQIENYLAGKYNLTIN
jgi:hypothetical protein